MATSAGKKILSSPSLKSVIDLHSSKIPKDILKSTSALLSSAPSGGKHALPDLKFDYGALERKLIFH